MKINLELDTNIVMKEFFITNLYEERDIAITFDSPYRILVAENGYGKTTILNSFYALLSGDTSKLSKIKFDKVGIKFSDGNEVSFNKREFNSDFLISEEEPFLKYIEKELSRDVVLELLSELRQHSFHRMHLLPTYQYIEERLDLPQDIMKDNLRSVLRTIRQNDDKAKARTKNKIDLIQSKLKLKTLYLPTYRRVEEDIRVFSRLKTKNSNSHSAINFGIADVKENIDKITSEILQSSAESFLRINGQILSQLIDGFTITSDMRDSVSDPKSVRIVLDRIGKNFSNENKQQVSDMIKIKSIYHDNNNALLYFVSSLLEVYKKQQENDEAIKNFSYYCNKYLVDKKIDYDESSVTVSINRKKSGKPVDFESLSSGEKQIISLFSILYLQKKDNLAIFFDEPELSLSMEWQKTLLPDIINSGKCKFLFATTHSPFIFENDLQKNTVDLSEYIREL